ncbi:hypothetical protein [Vibrio agarivorans]|uniref:hypothetical protein n=1 Tax=Vibrio agarivorans TaxID=153622 RepID=UPI002231E05D|nr:hypothetical protein [Vibrio agarivorans]MDN3659965.1 hypothetical protein [Vibrio agarivorans]
MNKLLPLSLIFTALSAQATEYEPENAISVAYGDKMFSTTFYLNNSFYLGVATNQESTDSIQPTLSQER